MESAKLIACNMCATHGKKIGKVKTNTPEPKVKYKEKQTKKEEEPIILVVDNYNQLIKKKREKLGLKQETLAKQLNEKESLIQQIEAKKAEPSIKLAEKLERKLNITLLEKYEPNLVTKKDSKEDKTVTLGDMIQIKTRKKK